MAPPNAPPAVLFSPRCRNRDGPDVIGSAAHEARAKKRGDSKMQYMLLIYGDESARAHATKEQMGQMFAAYGAYTEAMKKAGVFKAGDPLEAASTATTVRVSDGKTKVLNGPYVESKEQLG